MIDRVAQFLKRLFSDSRVVANSGWILFERLYRFGLGFLVGVLVARYLGPEDFGTYTFALTVVTLFSIVSTLGLNNVVLKDLNGQHLAESSILGTGVALKVLGGFCVVLFGWLAGVLVLKDEKVTEMTLIISLSYPFLALSLLEVWFQNRMRAKLYTYARFGSLTTSAALKLVLIFVEADVIWFATTVVVEAMILAVVVWLFFRREQEKPGPWRFDTVYCAQLLRESTPLALMTFSGIVYTQIDKIMIGGLLSYSALGIYAVYIQIVAVPRLFFSSLNAGVAPVLIRHFEKGEVERYWGEVRRVLTINFAAAVVLGLGLALVGNLVVGVLFGYQFVGSQTMLLFLVASMLINAPAGLLINHIVLLKYSRPFLYVRVASLVINAGLNFLLIPRYGLEGAAFATLVTVLFVDLLAASFFKDSRRYFFTYLRSVMDVLTLSFLIRRGSRT